jgi:hypothetical protein
MSLINFPQNGRTRVPSGGGGVDNGGGPPHDSRMEERVKKLEQAVDKLADRTVNIERDVAVVRSNYATKEDLHKEISAQTWKLVTFVCGFGTALVGATYFIVKYTTA